MSTRARQCRGRGAAPTRDVGDRPDAEKPRLESLLEGLRQDSEADLALVGVPEHLRHVDGQGSGHAHASRPGAQGVHVPDGSQVPIHFGQLPRRRVQEPFHEGSAPDDQAAVGLEVGEQPLLEHVRRAEHPVVRRHFDGHGGVLVGGESGEFVYGVESIAGVHDAARGRVVPVVEPRGTGLPHKPALEGDRQFVVPDGLVVGRLVVAGGRVQVHVAVAQQGLHVLPLAVLDEHAVLGAARGDDGRRLATELAVEERSRLLHVGVAVRRCRRLAAAQHLGDDVVLQPVPVLVGGRAHPAGGGQDEHVRPDVLEALVQFLARLVAAVRIGVVLAYPRVVLLLADKVVVADLFDLRRGIDPEVGRIVDSPDGDRGAGVDPQSAAAVRLLPPEHEALVLGVRQVGGVREQSREVDPLAVAEGRRRHVDDAADLVVDPGVLGGEERDADVELDSPGVRSPGLRSPSGPDAKRRYEHWMGSGVRRVARCLRRFEAVGAA